MLALSFVSFGAVPVEDARAFAAAIDQACRTVVCVDGTVGMKQETVARLMGIKPQQLQEWKTGARNPNLWKFFNLTRDPDGDGQRWLEAFWPLGGRALGLPEYEVALRLQRAVVDAVSGPSRLRMAKASLPGAVKERVV